jgi:nitrous oxidase accessory protein NosD
VVRHCDLTYNLFGLWIEKADDVRVEGNTITGKRDYNSAQRGNGVQLYNTKGARIIDNNISFVRDALYVDVSHHAIFKGNRLHHSRYGTHYMNSYYNLWEDNDSYNNRGGLALMEVRDQVVRNNRTWGNADHGIMLRTLQDSRVENNVVADNDRGSSSTTSNTRSCAATWSSAIRLASTFRLDQRATWCRATTSSATGNRCAIWARAMNPGAGANRRNATRATSGATTSAGTAMAMALAICPMRPAMSSTA